MHSLPFDFLYRKRGTNGINAYALEHMRRFFFLRKKQTIVPDAAANTFQILRPTEGRPSFFFLKVRESCQTLPLLGALVLLQPFLLSCWSDASTPGGMCLALFPDPEIFTTLLGSLIPHPLHYIIDSWVHQAFMQMPVLQK